MKSADRYDVQFKHQNLSFYQENFRKEFNAFFKFSVVRNTWDWLVSRYFWSKDHQQVIDITFEEFIKRIANRKEINPRAKWLNYTLRPQLDRLQIKGEIGVDYVGRFEELQTSFNYICKQLHIPYTRLSVINKSIHSHYSEYYTKELIDIVSDLYYRDIDFFKFRFTERDD